MISRRLIQLTDCHLFADPQQSIRNIVTWPRFELALQTIANLGGPWDLLVMTGDTAHDELPETYQQVRRRLEPWLTRLRIVPGNHDQREGLRSTGLATGGGDLPGRVVFQVCWDDWQVIGLDSQRPGELPGELGADQVAWLRQKLADTPGLPTALLLHHPPILLHSEWLDRIGLQDAPALAAVVRDFPQVRLISCGHVHQESAGNLQGATVLTTPAAGPQFRQRRPTLEIEPAPPGFRIIDLLPDGAWTTQVVRCREE